MSSPEENTVLNYKNTIQTNYMDVPEHSLKAVVAVRMVRSCVRRESVVRGAEAGYRTGLNAARTSVANSSGSSQAAKCPPLSTSLK